MATIVPLFGGEDRLTVKANGEDLTAGQLVKITAFTAGELLAAKSVATGGADAAMNVDADDGEKGAAVILVPGTVMKLQSETGVAAGDLVKSSANGKVTTASPSANNAACDDGLIIIGRALTAVSGGFATVLIK